MDDPHKPGSSTASILGALASGLVLGALVFGLIGFLVLSRNSGPELLGRLWSKFTGRTLSLDVTQPTVVERIQKLQRLETVVYTMDKVVSGAKENPIFPDFLAGDRLLMLVHGEVVAGIDFSSLKPGDVQVQGKQVHIHLPAAQVFSTRLDSARTRVYSRQTGLLVSTDPDLETQVRQEAERQLSAAALADGILRTAQQNGTATITSLLQGLGFEKIDLD
jgi:hypothetical protein